jgi:magnesium chelatase subunit D
MATGLSTDAGLEIEALGVVAVDPLGVGGVLLRVRPGPHLDAWLHALQAALPKGTPWRRLPAHADPSRLAAETDVVATLASGRRTARPGLLREADRGFVVVPMAERIEPGVAALLGEALDTGSIAPREVGLAPEPARIALVLLDESRPDESGAPRLLAERVGVQFALEPQPGALADWPSAEAQGYASGAYSGITRAAIMAARERLPEVTIASDLEQAIVEASVALGIDTLRPAQRALRVARARAALEGRLQVRDDDVAVAAALVLMPRATRLPQAPPSEDDLPDDAPPDAVPPPPPPESDPPASDANDADQPIGRLADRVVEAARAHLPDELPQTDPGVGFGGGGRRGALIRQLHHGHRVGARPGDPRRGGRVDLAATLRAAAPWQTVRRRRAEERAAGDDGLPAPLRRAYVEKGDLHIQVRARRAATATIFMVDASGSQALNRLAEVKGAVELLLSDSYVRREQVALVSFRGREAELALPATRSLVRARRTLGGMIGGGGTPLALGLMEGLRTALRLRSDALAPRLVLLTDGRPNVDRQGEGGRAQAREDALAAARLIRAHALPGVVLDTSPRGEPFAAELAREMGLPHLHLPRADARHVRAALGRLDAS